MDFPSNFINVLIFVGSPICMNEINISNDILFSEVLEMLRQGKRVMIPAKGVSMLPLIRGHKDRLILEGYASSEDVSKGDIVLFRFNGSYIVHRVVKITGRGARLRGDATTGRCEECSLSEIYGKVTGIQKTSGRMINPNGRWRRRTAGLWLILPFRRHIAAVYKRLPWNRWLMDETL